MSYGIALTNSAGQRLQLPESATAPTGGTYAVGGTRDAWFSITWNYTPFFFQTIDKEKGIRWLYGKTAAETVPRLLDAVRDLSRLSEGFVYAKPADVTIGGVLFRGPEADNYWASTPQNAQRAILGLLALATELPHGIWAGD